MNISIMVICGIDPGLETTGYAVLRYDGAGCAAILDAGIIRSTVTASLADRLVQLADDFAEVLTQWRPSAVGVEQLYSHYKHPRTAIQMGHARGVLLATAARAGAGVVSFSATHIKKHLTGNGRASKTQVQQTVQALFRLTAAPEPADLADAIAIAYCCGNEARMGSPNVAGPIMAAEIPGLDSENCVGELDGVGSLGSRPVL